MAGCFVYVIAIRRGGDAVPPIKVGISSDPAGRLRTFQTACPYPLVLRGAYLFESRDLAERIERTFHREQRDRQTHGEWFDLSPLRAVTWLARVVLRVLGPGERGLAVSHSSGLAEDVLALVPPERAVEVRAENGW
jgi:hypothetical protein